MTTVFSSAPRIVCLSHDSVDMLIQMDAAQMVVGRPSGEKRAEVAHAQSVGGYGSISVEKVKVLRPDVVIAYAAFQSKQVAAMVDDGINLLTLSHRCMDEIFQSMRLLAWLTGKTAVAEAQITQARMRLDEFSKRNRLHQRVPVYFEEWDQPMVVAPKWVSEMIHYAGGEDVFAERSAQPEFKHRVVTVDDIIRANPDVIVASWCGKPVKVESIRSRPGIGAVTAVQLDRMYEVNGDHFLRPGPSLLKGIVTLHNILHPDFLMRHHE